MSLVPWALSQKLSGLLRMQIHRALGVVGDHIVSGRKEGTRLQFIVIPSGEAIASSQLLIDEIINLVQACSPDTHVVNSPGSDIIKTVPWDKGDITLIVDGNNLFPLRGDDDGALRILRYFLSHLRANEASRVLFIIVTTALPTIFIYMLKKTMARAVGQITLLVPQSIVCCPIHIDIDLCDSILGELLSEGILPSKDSINYMNSLEGSELIMLPDMIYRALTENELRQTKTVGYLCKILSTCLLIYQTIIRYIPFKTEPSTFCLFLINMLKGRLDQWPHSQVITSAVERGLHVSRMAALSKCICKILEKESTGTDLTDAPNWVLEYNNTLTKEISLLSNDLANIASWSTSRRTQHAHIIFNTIYGGVIGHLCPLRFWDTAFTTENSSLFLVGRHNNSNAQFDSLISSYNDTICEAAWNILKTMRAGSIAANILFHQAVENYFKTHWIRPDDYAALINDFIAFLMALQQAQTVTITVQSARLIVEMIA
ncbi:hypothetical protein QR46_4896 [Giardia duodenalis assemblage B]|uniref:Uncharacterized protein n=1 Tax=Giardia duodenalis assemblage B TaxID=1394984 RepID=A0A132NM86_GIAIN|nr:hypothetical protein QR46_4896 [Giardia intestinalis assemblage B]